MMANAGCAQLALASRGRTIKHLEDILRAECLSLRAGGWSCRAFRVFRAHCTNRKFSPIRRARLVHPLGESLLVKLAEGFEHLALQLASGLAHRL